MSFSALRKFLLRVYTFLIQQEANHTMQRLHRKQPLTPGDLDELERFLLSHVLARSRRSSGPQRSATAWECSHASWWVYPERDRSVYSLAGLTSPPQQPEHQGQAG